MNTINKKIENNYLNQNAILDYQKVKACIGQGFRILEKENCQDNKPAKEDFILEKLITNLNGGIGRMITTELVVPEFGWGRGFFLSMQLTTSKVDNK